MARRDVQQQRCKRYEELFEIERRKAEESREVKEHLQRHISKWESLKEELGLLHRSKELQDNELSRLRKGIYLQIFIPACVKTLLGFLKTTIHSMQHQIMKIYGKRETR